MLETTWTDKKVLNSKVKTFRAFFFSSFWLLYREQYHKKSREVWVHIAIFKDTIRKIKVKKFILMTAYWFEISSRGRETIVWLMPNFGNDKTPRGTRKIDRFLTAKNTSLYRKNLKRLFYCLTDESEKIFRDKSQCTMHSHSSEITSSSYDLKAKWFFCLFHHALMMCIPLHFWSQVFKFS